MVPSSATWNGVAFSSTMATKGTASRLTCVPNWEMVSAIHSRRKSGCPSSPTGSGALRSRGRHPLCLPRAPVASAPEARDRLGDLVEQRRVGVAGEHPDE